MTPLRLLDVVLVAVTAPVVVLLGAPVLGTIVGATAWIANRAAELLLDRRARHSDTPQQALGLNLAGVIGRAWLVALTILAVGIAGDRSDGLAAAVLILAAFTLHFVTTLLSRLLERNPATS
jgi:hypothetical protein